MNIKFKLNKNSSVNFGVALYSILIGDIEVGHYSVFNHKPGVSTEIYLPNHEGKIIKIDFPDEKLARKNIPEMIKNWYDEAGDRKKTQVREGGNLYAYWGNYPVGAVVKQQGKLYVYECSSQEYFGASNKPISFSSEQEALEMIYGFYDDIQKEIK